MKVVMQDVSFSAETLNMQVACSSEKFSSFLPSSAVLHLEDLVHQQEHGHVMTISAIPQMCRHFTPVVYANF